MRWAWRNSVRAVQSVANAHWKQLLRLLGVMGFLAGLRMPMVLGPVACTLAAGPKIVIVT